MTAFTRHLSELGLDLPATDNGLTERLDQDFPGLEHGLAGTIDQSAVFLSDAATLLIPADESQSCRSALEALLEQRLAEGGPAVVLDLDISSPHEQFLGAANHEGLSDHFLYGVSREKLLRESRTFPGVRVITPGTYTPRAADIYNDRKWQGLLDWLSGLDFGPLVLIGPPVSRYSDFSFLSAAGSVLLVTSDEPPAVSGLPDRLGVIRSRLPESASLRVLWVSELRETPEESTLADLAPAGETGESAGLPELTALPGEEPDLDSLLSQEEMSHEDLALPEELPQDELSLADLTPAGETGDSAGLPELTTLPGEELELDSLLSQEEMPPEDLALPEELPQDELSLADLTPAGETGDSAGLPELTALPGEEPDLDSLLSQKETSPEDLTLPEELPQESYALPGDESESQEPVAQTGITEDQGGLSPESNAEEEEIFLPRELLFLDEEDERRGAGTVTRAGAEGKSFEQELDDLSRGELPDLPTESRPVKNASQSEAMTEPAGFESAKEADNNYLSETLTAGIQESPDISEALFTDAGPELDEEQRITAQPSGELLDPEQAEQALQKIEGFEDALSAPDEPEVELNLDFDPLAESASLSAEELEPLETGVMPGGEIETGMEAVSLPENEAAILPEEEIPALEDEAIEELAPEELEAAPGADLEAAASVEELPELPEEEPAGQAIAPLDDVDIENLEMELDKASGPSTGTDELVELDDEGRPQAAPSVAKPIAPPASSRNNAGPDIDGLLQEDTDLSALDTDIDLGDAAIPGVITKAEKPRKKGRKKRSATRTLVWITLLLLMTGGLFVIWKDGTVSFLLRRSPFLNEMLAKAGINLPALQDMQNEPAVQTTPDTSAAAKTAKPEPELQNYEYSIQVGSYRFLPQALEARDRLIQGGLTDVFVAPVILDSLGSWNRLYVGCYTSSEQADTALARILPELRKSAAGSEGSSQPIKRRTPWTINLGDFGASDSLETLRTRLANFEIPSYAIQISADSTGVKKFRLYVGAFEDQEQAVYIRTRLFNIGVAGSIEEREGPVATSTEPARPAGQV